MAPGARRTWQVTSAFTWFGYTEELAYPLNFALRQAQPLFSVLVYYFLQRLVTSGPSVAFDYFTFVVIGGMIVRPLDSGRGSFSPTLAETGNHVICADIDADKVALLSRGEVPIYEPGLDRLLARNLEEGRLEFTTEVGAAVARKFRLEFQPNPEIRNAFIFRAGAKF